MAFTDDEVLVLLDLDLELGDLALPTRWSRLRDAAWWLTMAVGSLAVIYLALQADYGFTPPRFTG